MGALRPLAVEDASIYNWESTSFMIELLPDECVVLGVLAHCSAGF
jgi:hypothetical protein